MKRLLFVFSVSFAACASPADKGREQMEEALEAKSKNDSILSEFKKINEQLVKTRDSLKLELDSTYRSLDSALKSN